MWWLYILGGIIIVLISFFVIKKYVWDKPNNEVKLLKQEIESLKKSHKEEISDLKIKIFNGEKDIEKLQIRHANEIKQLRTRLNNDKTGDGSLSYLHTVSPAVKSVKKVIDNAEFDTFALNEVVLFGHFITYCL